ncbi:Transcription factor TFIIIB component B'' like protein [Eufriesea mexicana]|uniref:Transcription factor TFIIIB component B'' like protein n=1 Tax=Eufriesea mexicana TaxID=516756 RepID=A0A310SLR1_9HYME|nr:PREDICTED: transcription factor TFIIIB component B'' homolog [Eufriesea mexicana]OAD57504.1 Transcription factor TFIIIB component B'' like protein [Eufriesea mexicana]
MKRARIKAMVTVPTRRKAIQDVSVTEITNSTEFSEKNKNISNDINITSQQISKDISQEKHIEENVDNTKELKQIQEVEEEMQNEQLHIDNQCNEYKDDFAQNSEKFKKEIIQSPEISNTTQITSSSKLTQNRCGFTKPTPKFDNSNRARRNSIQGSGASTSESEDDSRRLSFTNTNHTRNELVQLTPNAKDTITNNTKNNLITSKVGQKRRILVSESARKLAEARREFHLKHENKTPDRSKLTMYDLIYYNPVTNPMKKPAGSAITRKILECQPEEIEEEENEDDPSSAMPVPQVKVGPNGQLIIDEQSLVIEQTNAKRSRKVLAKEAIIDDDNSGSGFYKKRQKSKEWSQQETLNFYKALNTIGTDFLLMQSLFPNRTRQEMKLKFKKEEKINRSLVEKALEYHQEFDTEILEKSLASFDNSDKEYFDMQGKQKQRRIKDRKNTKAKKRRKSHRLVATSIAEMGTSDNEEDALDSIEYEENTDINDKYEETLNKTNKKICKKATEEKMPERYDIESLSSCNDIDSDTEVYRVRPTRSGRLPKVKKLQGPDINTLDNERLNYSSNDQDITISSEDNVKDAENIIFDSINLNSDVHHIDPLKTVLPNIGNVEPGSLVILSKESLEEPGKSVLQVYMVSPDVNS